MGELFPQYKPAGSSKDYCSLQDVIGGDVIDGECYCNLKLGAEHNFETFDELAAIDYTAKEMAQRQLNVGAYDPIGQCNDGQLGDASCCDFASNGHATHACWLVNNDIAWDGTLLSSSQAFVPVPAQYAGCEGGVAVVNYTTGQTYCDYADKYYEKGCDALRTAVTSSLQLFISANANGNGLHTEGPAWKDFHQRLKTELDLGEVANVQNDVLLKYITSQVVEAINGNALESLMTKFSAQDWCLMHPLSTMYVYNLPAAGDPSAQAKRTMPTGSVIGGYNSSLYNTHYSTSGQPPKLQPQSLGGFNMDPSHPQGEWQHAFKQMHGKGFSCVNARLKVLDIAEEEKLNAAGVSVLPSKYRFGIFEKANNGEGRQWPTLLRFAGNRNHTVFDWHDIRVNGLGIKIYDAADVTGTQGEHRIKLAHVPRNDYADGPAPNNGSGVVSGIGQAAERFTGDLQTYQNLTTIDFLFIAVRGQGQQNCPYNKAPCVVNSFPAGGDAVSYSPNFLNGTDYSGRKLHPHNVTWSTWNPLNYTYGSAGAHKLGNDMAMKVLVQPCGMGEGSDPTVDHWKSLRNDFQDPTRPNFRYDNMNATLSHSGLELCMFVQLQENPCTEPVEAADVLWKTTPRLVARLHIPKGEAPQYDNVCDNTVYHPYRQLDAHMPLGSLQRIRHTVYSYAQTFRLNINNKMSLSEEELRATKLPLDNKVPVPQPIKCPLGFV
jgi:hypothetical protein